MLTCVYQRLLRPQVLGIVPLHEIYCLSERLLQWTRPKRSGPFRPAITQARKFIGLFKMLRMVKLFRLHHFRSAPKIMMIL
jgi:hypothetical protein